jgi:PiT family inorganic phosphate transporter
VAATDFIRTPVDPSLAVFALTVALCYVYAFVGGFTDAANAIATAVGTRAFRPGVAVLVAGLFELLGALTGTAVALTIGKGIVSPALLDGPAVAAVLLGAMSWSVLTYLRGIPVSETHGLMGAIVGVGVFAGGARAIEWAGLLKVLAAIFVSPALGFLGATLLTGAVYRAGALLTRARATAVFTNLQRLSSMYMAFSHGRNDAQKPMGVLALAIAVHTGRADIDVPLWIIVTVAAVAALGVAAGGWRIIRTLGMRVTGLGVEQGFAAEASAATVLQVASELGVPVSTTHAITSAIVGAGTVRGRKGVRWNVVGEIAASWVLTIPATALLGYGLAWLLSVATAARGRPGGA